MEPIAAFMRSGNKFSLSLLCFIHSKLSAIQSQRGWVDQNDIENCMNSHPNFHQFSHAELFVHNSVLVESILIPFLSSDGIIKVRLRPDVSDDETFVACVLNTVYAKSEGVQYQLLEDFKQEALGYLKSIDVSKRFNLPDSAVTAAPMIRGYQSSRPSSAGSAALIAGSAAGVYDGLEDSYSTMRPTREPHYPDSRQQVEIERSEPIVRLLAQVRKVGMDILFPQSTHDKVGMNKAQNLHRENYDNSVMKTHYTSSCS